MKNKIYMNFSIKNEEDIKKDTIGEAKVEVEKSRLFKGLVIVRTGTNDMKVFKGLFYERAGKANEGI